MKGSKMKKKIIITAAALMVALPLAACGPEPTTVQECLEKYGQTEAGLDCTLRIAREEMARRGLTVEP